MGPAALGDDRVDSAGQMAQFRVGECFHCFTRKIPQETHPGSGSIIWSRSTSTVCVQIRSLPFILIGSSSIIGSVKIQHHADCLQIPSYHRSPASTVLPNPPTPVRARTQWGKASIPPCRRNSSTREVGLLLSRFFRRPVCCILTLTFPAGIRGTSRGPSSDPEFSWNRRWSRT